MVTSFFKPWNVTSEIPLSAFYSCNPTQIWRNLISPWLQFSLASHTNRIKIKIVSSRKRERNSYKCEFNWQNFGLDGEEERQKMKPPSSPTFLSEIFYTNQWSPVSFHWNMFKRVSGAAKRKKVFPSQLSPREHQTAPSAYVCLACYNATCVCVPVFVHVRDSLECLYGVCMNVPVCGCFECERASVCECASMWLLWMCACLCVCLRGLKRVQVFTCSPCSRGFSHPPLALDCNHRWEGNGKMWQEDIWPK